MRMKQYEEYKDSGVEWIGRVPSHWESIPLKYSASKEPNSFIDGDWIESKVITTDGIRYLTTGNVGPLSYKEQGNGFISEKTFKELNCTEVFPGDLLISRLNEPIGRTCIVPDLGYRIVVAVDNVIYRPCEKLDKKYIMYQMNCAPYTENANLLASGATMQRISRSKLGAIKILLPPLPEQHAIAEYLDAKCGEIDARVAKEQKRIELLGELKQSIITQAVTHGLNPNAPLKDSGVEWIGQVPEHWEVMKLKNICRKGKYAIKTGPFGTQLKGEELQPEGDVPVYSQRNVIDDDFTNVRFFVTKEKARQLQGFYTQSNDVLVTSRGTIGKSALLPNDVPMGILHPCLIALRIDQKVCSLDWIRSFLADTKSFLTDITLSSNATTIEVIYTETLKNVAIPVPPLSEQRAIATYLDEKCAKVDASIAEAERKVALLQELKQSIITEVVTGKRKVC